MTFTYCSTRGAAPDLDFRGVTMAGLASDGGLYVPCVWPDFSVAEIRAMRGQSYAEIACRVMRPFVEGVLDEATLRRLIEAAYAGFTDPAITPLRHLDADHYLLELFHGPTLAFKDVALQFLGQLFEHFLGETGEHLTVLGATSGDTGSAAIAAMAGRRGVATVILYPHHRPSEIQRRQMTCVTDPAVHVLAIDGSFDDCQQIVKALFNDPALRARHQLAAVNSLNWARILAQIVYYFVAAVQLGAPDRPVSFVVPTGNFGNVYAGYAALRCGLPIAKLAVASNSNDILPRFFTSGRMQVGQVAATLSPSMDIQHASNFERLLFELCARDPTKVVTQQNQFTTQGCYDLKPVQLGAARQFFTAASLTDTETLETIRNSFAASRIILDPHTAVGVGVAEKLARELPTPVVMLACAHPAKFPEVIHRALNLNAPVPESVADLLHKAERMSILPADIQAVSGFLSSNIKGHS